MFQNKLTHNLPLLKNVPNPKRASNMNKKISDSLKLTSRKIVILYGPQGTGKTWTSVDFARQRPNKDQRVIFLNSYTQDKLDFEYRKFAYDYVEISPSTRVDKLNLINEVNERLHDLELLFIFDDVRNLSEVDDYLQNLPTYAHVIVTTSLKNDPMSMNLELSGVDRIEQDLFTKKEAFDFVKSQLVNDLGDRSINELIDHLNGPQNKGVSPGELEKCCAILNNSSNKPQENLKAIIKSTKNLTELILDSRFKVVI
jgi:predicted AAA+ superfamily ATPase